MSNIFQIIGMLAVIGVLYVLARAHMRPDVFEVRRAARIAAPPEKIFPFINDFHAFNRWNPYERKDPDIKGSYSGAERGVGAAYAWESSKVGVGRMEITDEAAPSRVLMNLEFFKPFAARNTAEFTIAPDDDGAVVIWAMRGPVTYVAKIMHMFLNIDRIIGADFDNGLANLREIVEAE